MLYDARMDYKLIVEGQEHLVTNVTPSQVGKVAAVLSEGKGKPTDDGKYMRTDIKVERIA